jgi:putative transcriptional regulator
MVRILLSKKLGELRWTQADLARATGIRPSTINEYYHEFAERINLEHLDLICEALQCELSEILVRVPNAEPKVKSRSTARGRKKEENA